MRYTHTIAICLLLSSSVWGQKLDVKETWLSGYARSILYSDAYENDVEEDTVSATREMSGHTLLDLAANIKPNDKIFIQGMVRIRNDHGGFWGSGVTFDIRNLYLRGVVGNAFRYQVGDINYKLTPYTLYNSDEETSMNEVTSFALLRELNRYDLFYDDQNTWRQQGVTGEFGLRFKKVIEEMDFTLFTSRLNWAANGGLERLQGGGNVQLKYNKHLDLHLTYIDAFDIPGTNDLTAIYSNPVLTSGVGIHYDTESWNLDLASEFGQSRENLAIGEEVVEREDYFYDAKVMAEQSEGDLAFSLGVQEVGPGFRSIGAQTKRIDFDRYPRYLQRYGNEQMLRSIDLLDIIRDASIYNTQITPGLMSYDPRFGNVSPYGRATPNRRMMDIEAAWSPDEGPVELNLTSRMGQEIQGQGTPEARNFMIFNTSAALHLDRLLAIDRSIRLDAAYWYENTSRSGRESYEDIDLSNASMSIGLVAEFVQDFEFIAGYRNMNSEGNEFLLVTDEVGRIITFDPRDYDSQQQLYAVGLRYNFSENSLLNFQYTQFNLDDRTDVDEDYSISDFSIIYRMLF
ncbi:MAG: hypothetical protein HKN79_08325 [Flavobacteriales bacterium]|nr:hypothetical protein [Flavobacteriales bacterium]